MVRLLKSGKLSTSYSQNFTAQTKIGGILKIKTHSLSSGLIIRNKITRPCNKNTNDSLADRHQMQIVSLFYEGSLKIISI